MPLKQSLLPAYSPLIHRLALFTTAATLLLIFMGGLVTSNGAGMSVPDWPNSYGYNMFTFPVSRWVGGIFYEHTHRLMATLVGFCSTLLFLHAWGFGNTSRGRKTVGGLFALLLVFAAAALVGAWQTRSTALRITGELSLLAALVCPYAYFTRSPDPRSSIHWLTLAVLLGVILQGLLGGFRVVLIKLGLAIIHACVAQAFLCLVALLVTVSSAWWIRLPSEVNWRRPMALLLAACTLIIYSQLIIGALMRHYGAGLAIPDLPWAYGKLLPPINAAQLDHANALRLLDPAYAFPGAEPVTLFQIWLHFAHRCGAMVVTISVLTAIAFVLRGSTDLKLRRPALVMGALLVVQLTLGVLTVYWRKPADVASLHVVTGAATLMTCFVLFIRATRTAAPAAAARVDVVEHSPMMALAANA